MFLIIILLSLRLIKFRTILIISILVLLRLSNSFLGLISIVSFY